MPKFSRESIEKLSTCDPRLQQIMGHVIDHFDFKVISGRRTVKEQQFLVDQGFSKTMASKHCHDPSLAIDIAPWPVNWNDTERFIYLAGHVMMKAKEHGVNLKWGGDWDQDTEIKDTRFRDLGHFELVGEN